MNLQSIFLQNNYLLGVLTTNIDIIFKIPVFYTLQQYFKRKLEQISILK